MQTSRRLSDDLLDPRHSGAALRAGSLKGREPVRACKRSSIRTSSSAGPSSSPTADTRTGDAAGLWYSNGGRRLLERCAHHGCVVFTHRH